METGYDYLLLRKHLQHRLLNFSGIFIFVLGAMLLASSGVYYGYTAKARADLNTLNYSSIESTTSLAEVNTAQSLSPTRGTRNEEAQFDSGKVSPEVASPALSWAATAESVRQGTVEPANGSAATSVAGAPAASVSARAVRSFSAAAIGSQQLFPGESLQGRFWSDPFSYESAAYREQALLRGFIPVEPGQELLLGSVAPATRLTVPSIDLDSRVDELAILDLGGSRAYETPKNTVGHIPETASAGEAGSSWLFGHTESPILGEGSVFFNLSKIPGMLQDGKDVFVITDNGEQQFLYRINSSRVVHQRDMKLYDTGRATIHLVSCVPRLVYDHRLIVSGELIGHK